ncbi:MAG: hypothetical protein H6835_04530 [Planctomycetes bacterium]|nr:hypothetical protein [Planctomycetota bacterium]
MQGPRGPRDADGDHDGDSSASISRRGQFLSELRELQQSDPAQAKQLLTDLADKIRSEDPKGQDPRRAAFAERLQQAADTGDIDSLFPSSGGKDGGQGGAPSAAIGAYTQAAKTGSSW